MQFVRPTLTVVAATISTLLTGSVLAAPAQRSQEAQADETLTVLGQTYRNTATKTRLDPIETPRPSRWWTARHWNSEVSVR